MLPSYLIVVQVVDQVLVGHGTVAFQLRVQRLLDNVEIVADLGAVDPTAAAEDPGTLLQNILEADVALEVADKGLVPQVGELPGNTAALVPALLPEALEQAPVVAVDVEELRVGHLVGELAVAIDRLQESNVVRRVQHRGGDHNAGLKRSTFLREDYKIPAHRKLKSTSIGV